MDAPAIVDSTLELGGDQASKVTLINNLILRAANNARKVAEKKHDFSWNEETLEGEIPLSGRGIHIHDLFIVNSLEGSLVDSGGTGTLTMDYGANQGLNANSPIPFKDSHLYFVIAPVTSGDFTTQRVTPVDSGNLITGWPVYAFPTTAITDGTYRVKVKSTSSTTPTTINDYRKIKTLLSAWTVDTTDNSEVPIRIERKQRVAQRMLEYQDRRVPENDTWAFPHLLVIGEHIFLYPENTDKATTIRLDANVWSFDYDDDGDSDPFLEHGFDYMQWACVVEVNKMLRQFVHRQEGNIGPPVAERDEALKQLIEFDISTTEEAMVDDLD